MLNLLVDFDGTVCDSAEGVLKSVEYALDKLDSNLDVPYAELSVMFLGPPLSLPFGEIFSGDSDKVALAIEYFRERYNTLGVYENTLYDGIVECMRDLTKEGVRVCIASSKPDVFIKSILERNNALDSFEAIFAPGLDGEKLTKLDIVLKALEYIKSIDPNPRVFMVGDRKYDVDGAHLAGIPCIGVEWGYADDNELSEHGAEYIVNNPGELFDLAVALSRKGNHNE